jgi:hypothetical protein
VINPRHINAVVAAGDHLGLVEQPALVNRLTDVRMRVSEAGLRAAWQRKGRFEEEGHALSVACPFCFEEHWAMLRSDRRKRRSNLIYHRIWR